MEEGIFELNFTIFVLRVLLGWNDNGKEVHGKGKLQEEKTEGSQTCRVQVCKSSSLATRQGA